jgi:hypothetical protein
MHNTDFVLRPIAPGALNVIDSVRRNADSAVVEVER